MSRGVKRGRSSVASFLELTESWTEKAIHAGRQRPLCGKHGTWDAFEAQLLVISETEGERSPA